MKKWKRQSVLGLDTNVLVYAHRAELPEFEVARRLMSDILRGKEKVGFTHTVLHEFIATVTSAGKFPRPSTMTEALAQIDYWLAAPNASVINATLDHFEALSELTKSGDFNGQKIYDAQIAAVCIGNKVSEFLTNDAGFEKFTQLRIRNPFTGPLKWQPTDEFLIHGDVTVRSDVNADIAQMYEEMMANDFMSTDEDK
jgi:toxin-antitoxin system PIN domain toxin